MRESDMLAGLVAQAEGSGNDLLMIRAIIEEASMMGADRALDRLGLSDRGAERDVQELRELLRGWRDAKRVARRTVLAWVARIAVALLLLGLALRADLWPGVRA